MNKLPVTANIVYNVDMTTTAPIEGNAMTAEFAHVTAGCLPTGTATSLGVIERTSLTAYLIGDAWVPFARLHGRGEPVEPLVRLA